MGFFGTSVNGLIVTRNFNFNPDARPFNNAIISDGQLIIGSTSAPNVRVGQLSSSDGSVQITNGPGTIDLKVKNLQVANWVPFITADGSAPTVTYDVQRGIAIKMERFVWAQALVRMTSYSGGSGNIQLRNLPFVTGTSTTFPEGVATFSNITFSGNYAVAYCSDGDTYVGFNIITSSGAFTQLQASALTSNSEIGITLGYITDN